MVSDSKIVAMPRRRGALQKAQTKKPTAGLALVNRALDDTIVNALVDAESFRAEMHRNHDGPPYLGEQDVSASGRFVERATPWMRHCLSKFARACDVSRLLADMTWMRPSALLTQADAIEMLRYLFGAMGKRRGDDAAAKLIACADIFSPTSNALGRATGLWKPVPLHPTFLALAIKHLMAAKTFEPSESELREALANVKNQVSMLSHWTGQWLERFERADEICFTFDRPAWNAAYARASVANVLAMRERVGLVEGPGCDCDENGDDLPPSARWRVLDELAKASEPTRGAACKVKPTKRVSKPKED